MKLLTWNINGIRSIKNFPETLSSFNADVICIQETKISRCQLDNQLAKIQGYYSFFNFSTSRQGYSGVATYTRKEYCPFDIGFQLSEMSNDTEGRILISHHKTEIDKIISIVNLYVPCGYLSEDVEKYEKKVNFLKDVQRTIMELESKGHIVVVAGDLNVKLNIIDSADAFENKNNVEFMQLWSECEDKHIFKTILNNLTDCFRYFYPDKKNCYTCWNSGLNARVNNYGTRIDYILISKSYQNLISECEILSEVLSSDHCPVSAFIMFPNIIKSEIVPPECTIFYPELKGEQTSIKDILKRKATIDSSESCNNLLSFPVHPEKRQKHDTKSNLSIQKTLFNFKTVSKVQSKSTQKPKKPCVNTHSPNHQINVKNPVCPKVDSYSTSHISVKTLLKGLPKPPLCSGHQLKTVLRTVKKEGPNCGKQFYCCQLPIGPSSSANSRCNVFQWINFKSSQKKVYNT